MRNGECKYHCVGCGKNIGWNGHGLFAYTCHCGSILFADENHRFAYPASFLFLMANYKGNDELPHIDYYLGFSNYTSEEKEAIYKVLRSRGAVWSWECEQCRNRYLQRMQMQRDYGLLANLQLHADLEKLLKA